MDISLKRNVLESESIPEWDFFFWTPLWSHDYHLLKQARFFDYECITAQGKSDQPRLVAFGKFAGMAGMIDGFQGLGLKLLAEGNEQNGLTTPNYTVALYLSIINLLSWTVHDITRQICLSVWKPC